MFHYKYFTVLYMCLYMSVKHCCCYVSSEYICICTFVCFFVKMCPHYETGLMRVEGKPDLSGLNSVSTRPHSIRVDVSSVNLNSLGYFKTAKANNNTSACCQIISILSATALEKRS